MKRNNRQAWLFAFTDLSFLLLISLSLIPSAPAGISLHFAEMEPPRVPESDSLAPVKTSEDAWELQVLAERPATFRLVRVDGRTGEERDSLSLENDTLLPALADLRQQEIRPVLLPARTSLSQDFLFAAATLARVWGDSRSPTIVKPEPIGEHE